MDYIEIKLLNFEIWKDKSIRLYKGMNELKGRNGIGKSTFPRAIHFVLYGGRKHKNILNNTVETNSKVSVTFKYKTKDEKFTIIRERPSETLSVKVDYETLRNEHAQAWVNARFGTEESWISSSYLKQDTNNFFMCETNAKKQNLLHQITFGDQNSNIDPERLNSILDEKLNGLKTKFDKSIKYIESRIVLMDDIKEENEDISDSKEVDQESVDIVKKTIKDNKKLIKNYESLLHDQESNNKLKKEIDFLEQNLSKIKIDNLEFIESSIPLIKEKEELMEKLKNFDPRCINISIDEIYNNKNIYMNLMKHGWDKKEPIKDFKDRLVNMKTKYENYLELLSQQKEIDFYNSSIKLLNKKEKDNYEIKLKEYKNYVKNKNEYELKNKELNKHKRKLEDIHIQNINNEDDLTEEFANKCVEIFKTEKEQLICPHCENGVYFKKSRLIKGTAQSITDLEQINIKYEKSLEEVSKRKVITTINKDINSYKHLTEPEEIEEPKKPVYLKEKEDLEITKVKKPEDVEIVLPSLDFKYTVDIYNSIPLISSYERLQSLENVDINIDLKKLKKEIKVYKDSKSLLEGYKNIYVEKDDVDYENLISKCKKIISKSEKKILFYKSLVKYQNIKRELDKETKNRDIIVNDMSELKELKEFVNDISRDSIDEIVDSVNLHIQDICNELFDKSISIKLKTIKELKNGKEKPNVNIDIYLDNVKYDSYESISGGEKKKVSLAILLAFMKNNSSPICILDEVLPSIDLKAKNKALDLIKEMSQDKFVINICHGVQSSKHDHIIDFEED